MPARNPAAGCDLETQTIVRVEELKHGLKGVIAVRTPAGDMQEQIELGRCRPVSVIRLFTC
jgi:hypothetical protein